MQSAPRAVCVNRDGSATFFNGRKILIGGICTYLDFQTGTWYNEKRERPSKETLSRMTFLNPAVLVALVAAAIPLLLHLVNLRKLRTVEFSTLAFLKQLEKNRMRRLKLRQILLLILRTLIVACLVLAFARPALRGTSVGGASMHATTTMALIFDDSFSMSATDEHGSLLNQGKAASQDVLSLLKQGDDLFFQKLSEGRGSRTPETLTQDFSAMKSAVSEAKISAISHTIGDVLGRTDKALKESRNFNKEIYLITDLQKTNFAADAEEKLRPTTGLQQSFDAHTRLFLVPIGHAPVENIGVDAVKIPNRIFEKDKPFSAEATIRNYSNTLLRNYTVSMYLDGTRVTQKSVDLPPEGVAIVEFTGAPRRTGYIGGYVQIDPDAVDQDNQRYFTIFVPEKIDILFITNSQRDISFLKLALAADERGQSLYGIQTIPSSKLLTTTLSRFDVVIISNVKSFSSEEVEQLRQFVSDGGGIIFFPGSEVDVVQYSATFCQKLNIAPFLGRTGSPSDGNSFLTFENVDLGHPLFSGMFEAKPTAGRGRELSIESPHISTTLLYRPGARGESIIRLSNGTSFLTDYRVGNGRLLLYSVAPTLEWSDFPLKGIFVPLIRRSLAYLASSNDQITDHLTGSVVNVTLPSKMFEPDQETSVLHKSPDGDEEVIQPNTNQRGGEREFAIKKTDIPGIHGVVRDKQVLFAFSVNVDPKESDTRRITIDDAMKWLSEHGLHREAIKVLDPNEHPDAVVLQSRYGVELWRYFLGFAIACALIEMMVARSKRKAGEKPEE
jgi:hypothetical protein